MKTKLIIGTTLLIASILTGCAETASMQGKQRAESYDWDKDVENLYTSEITDLKVRQLTADAQNNVAVKQIKLFVKTKGGGGGK